MEDIELEIEEQTYTGLTEYLNDSLCSEYDEYITEDGIGKSFLKATFNKKNIKNSALGYVEGTLGATALGSGVMLAAGTCPAVGVAMAVAGGALAARGMYRSIKGQVGWFREYFKARNHKDGELSKEDEEKANNELMDRSIAVAKKAAKDEKDPKKKNALNLAITSHTAAVYDENGNRRSAEDMKKNLKDKLGKDFDKTMDGVKKSAEKFDHKELDDVSKDDLKLSREQDQSNAKKIHKAIAKAEKEKKDGEDGVKKDKDGNILKKEEVVDKETGKKIKVVTHTGPRGGRFYWPDGAPKDADHKVYVQESDIVRKDLSSYLTEVFGTSEE